MLKPFSGHPARFELDGITYLVKEPTDEVEAQLIEIDATYPQTATEREKLFEDRKKYWKYLSENVDIILVGWEGFDLPFPGNSKPSLCLNWKIRALILDFYRQLKTIGAEDLKK